MLDLDLEKENTVPTLEAVKLSDERLTPPLERSIRRPDLTQRPPQFKKLQFKKPTLMSINQQQPTSVVGGEPRTDPEKMIFQPVSLLQADDFPLYDVPTLVMPAVLEQEAVKGEGRKVQKKKSSLGTVVRVGVTVLLFAFLLKSTSWSKLVPTLLNVSHSYLLLGLAAGVLCLLFSCYGWRSVVLAENIRVDLARLIDLYLVGVSFSHFLPTSMGGDAVKAYYVGRDSSNIPGAASAVLMSRITSFVGMLLIAIPALAVLHKHFTNQIVLSFLLLSLLMISAIVGSAFAALFLPRLSSRFLRGKLTQYRVFVKFLEVGEALSYAFRRPRPLFAATAFGMLFWVASFLNYYGYGAALGLHVPLTFYVIAIPFVSIVAALPISINGFGVREGVFVYLFTTIHVPSTISLSLALLMDAQVLFFGLLGGCIYLTMSGRRKS